MKCKLDYARSYSFIHAYSREPHVSFLNLQRDEAHSQLVAFIQMWGPLRRPSYSPTGTPWMDIRWYWDFQRELKATAHLLRAFCTRRAEEEALDKFLAVKRQQHPPSQTTIEEFSLAVSVPDDPCLPGLLRSPTDAILLDWNSRTNRDLRRQAVAGLIQRQFAMGARMVPNWRSGEIELIWGLDDLEDALMWMVFQDAITEHIPQVCPECQRVFRPTTRHKNKFCSYECAHRAAARNWYRKNLRKRKMRSGKEKCGDGAISERQHMVV